MNKYVKIIGVAALIGIVALVALAGAAVAFAQSSNPSPTPPPFGGYGHGMMGYGMGPGVMGSGYGFMAEYRDVIHAQITEAHANGGGPMAGRGRGMMGPMGARGFNGACPFANATPNP